MMRLLLLALLAAGLGGVIAWEVAGYGPSEAPSLAAPRRARQASPAATAVPDRSQDWIAQSLARPLFSPDRRPAQVNAAGAANGPAGPPRLTGILITPAGRQAIFAGEERSSVVSEGGSVGGYRVQSIANEQVVVSGPSGLHALRPSFGATEGRNSASTRRPAPDTAEAFAANPAPSGLDILRNAARQATAEGAAAAPDAPEPGVDALAAGRASRPPADRNGAPPNR